MSKFSGEFVGSRPYFPTEVLLDESNKRRVAFESFWKELEPEWEALGYEVTALIQGSVQKQTAHAKSDIDVSIRIKKFQGAVSVPDEAIVRSKIMDKAREKKFPYELDLWLGDRYGQVFTRFIAQQRALQDLRNTRKY